MILRETSEGLLCFRQLDHAAFSGELADAWGGEAVPRLRPEEAVVHAIRCHDAGWPELDESPTLDPDTGFPYDYRTFPLEHRLEVAERSVARVADADPYAGWLVSRHFASFHQGSDEPAAIRWVTRQVGRRAEMLARARSRVGRDALHPHVLEANLDFLQLLDAISLAVCHDWEAWESRPLAREYGEERRVYRYERLESGFPRLRARVDPAPFAAAPVEVEIAARLLDGAGWGDPDELADAWERAEEVAVEVVLHAR